MAERKLLALIQNWLNTTGPVEQRPLEDEALRRLSAAISEINSNGRITFAVTPDGVTDAEVVIDVTDPTYGATGDGVTDDTAAVQAAINAAIAVNGHLFFPAGTYSCSQLDFTNITDVSNIAGFGLKVSGVGMGSVLKSDGSTTLFLNFNHATDDLQLTMSDLFINGSGCDGTDAISFGYLNRYSSLRNVRIRGFRYGVLITKILQSMTFYNVSIRGCARSAMLVTGSNLAFMWIGGTVDNNGTASTAGAGGGVYYLALDLLSTVGAFYGVVVEDNYAGALRTTDCNLLSFYGCRFEEKIPAASLWAAPGNLHVWQGVLGSHVAFENCYFAYYSTGGVNLATTSCDLTFTRCLFEDAAVGGGACFNPSGTIDLEFYDCAFTGCIGPGGTYGYLPVVTGLSVVERGTSARRRTILRFTNVACALTDEAGVVAYCGKKVYEFPEGLIQFHGAVADLALTKSSAGVNDDWDGDFALGTSTAGNNTELTYVEQNLIPSTATPQAVAGATTAHGGTVVPEVGTAGIVSASMLLNGMSSAKSVYLNFLVDDADHDVTATPCNLIVNGTVTLHWSSLGDY